MVKFLKYSPNPPLKLKLINHCYFQLTAFLLLAVGSTISTIFEDFDIFMDDHFFTPANMMIFISICLMIVAITGCIGAIKESTMLVNIVSSKSVSHFMVLNSH